MRILKNPTYVFGSILLVAVAFFTHCQVTEAKETFSAVVEDGTAKEIEATQNAEEPKNFEGTEEDSKLDLSVSEEEIESITDVPYALTKTPIDIETPKIQSPENLSETEEPQKVIIQVTQAPTATQNAESPSSCVPTKAKTHPPKNQSEELAKEFDLVPKGKTPELMQRLRYTAYLVKKYNRAYDYRIHTLKQLKRIVKDLKSKAGKKE